MKATPQIKTDRLLLRPIQESDLHKVFEGLSDPKVTAYYDVSFDTLEATREQMAWFAQPEQHWFAICSLDNTLFFGATGLNSISKTHKKSEIGLWLLPAHWGKGIMQEVLPLICQYGFEQFGLHRIEGFVDAENSNCKTAMSKLDFVHEGTMRECEVKNGKYVSIEIYAVLNPHG